MKTKNYNVRFKNDPQASLSMEATGLLSVPPQSEAEYRSYQELSDLTK
jgi:hypothetical protein